MTLAEDHVTDELTSGVTLLYGQYTIERHLIDGGFGMTYLARDSLDRRVVVKECFPSSICLRIAGEVRPRKPSHQDQFQSVIRNFLREALRLAKFEHPNIVKVHQVFQENNTAYIAMDFVDGMDLLTMLDMDPGRLTDDVLVKLLRETLNALDYVHDFGMLHRDISPDNLLLDADNKLTLIDFGAAREETRQKTTRALSTVLSVKDGYSPHEFYYTDGSQEPSSDLYSVGATFYHLITGIAPPDCQKRLAALTSGEPDPYKPLSSGNWAFGKAFLASIDRALSVSQKKRFQSVAEWIDVLERNEVLVLQQDACVVTALEDIDLPEERRQADVVAETQESSPAQKTPQIKELDASVARAISRIVQDTNVGLEPALPGQKQQRAEALAAAEEKEDDRLVDMFGCPIDDVDKWMREQDKMSKRQRARENRYVLTPEPGQAPGTESPGFGLTRVLKTFVKRRRRTTAMIET